MSSFLLDSLLCPDFEKSIHEDEVEAFMEETLWQSTGLKITSVIHGADKPRPVGIGHVGV